MGMTLIQIPNGVFCATLINNGEGILCNGKPYSKIVDFCNEYRISSHKLMKRLKRDIKLSEAIRMGVQDSEGIPVEYIDDITPEQLYNYCIMRDIRGAAITRVSKLIQNKGKSLEEAVELTITIQNPPPVDGVRYNNCRELAQALGLKDSIYLERKIMEEGFSSAIIWAQSNAKKLVSRVKGFYYREVYYKSLKEASVKLGFGYSVARLYQTTHPDSTIPEAINHALMKKRYSQQKATALTSDASIKGMYVDHLGRQFPSVKEMCEQWGIPKKAYEDRVLKNHWTIEKALTVPVRHFTTFRNTTFKNISDACNVTCTTLYAHRDTLESYIFEDLLWRTPGGYIGLTENGELLVSQNEDIILMTFSEYIQTLLRHDRQCA